MSESVGHDVRKLAALFNERRSQVADRIIDPGTKAEQCNADGAAGPAFIKCGALVRNSVIAISRHSNVERCNDLDSSGYRVGVPRFGETGGTG